MKKWLILLVSILAIAIVVLIISTRPSVGKVVTPKDKITPTIASAEKLYDSDYFNFKYKSSYELSHIDTTDGRVLENIKIMGGQGSSLVMVITLTELSQELSDISGVQMRRSNTWQYSEEIARMGEKRGLLFKTADKKEKTAFFNKNNGVLTISMTTNSNDTEYDKEFQSFLDNFGWK